MRAKFAAGLPLTLVLLIGVGVPSEASADAIKPYILFVTDVSGSMDQATSYGNASCYNGAGADTRMSHLKCSLQNIINAYGGDMVLGLGRFRQRINLGQPPPNCDAFVLTCSPCQSDPMNCSTLMASGDQFEVLVPITEGNQNDLLGWVDFSVNTCVADNSMDPELFAEGGTPLTGALKGAKRYWQGMDTEGAPADAWNPMRPVEPYWVGPGDDPIRDDTLNNPPFVGPQCRPYITILLTDGYETCTADPDNTPTMAAAALLNTDVDGQIYRIETKPIALGRTPPDTRIEDIAHAGGAVDDGNPGTYEGYYAQDETELALAISDIIATSIKYEICNDLDDDCDQLVDEDFAGKGGACDRGGVGRCREIGILECSADGSGLECNPDIPPLGPIAETCNQEDDDCDGAIDESGVCAGCEVEICDNVDNDCDNAVDEDLTRSCGTDEGECVAGTETCVAGNWQGCDAVGGSAETCDGLDNDCDGRVDGLSEDCSVLMGGNPEIGLCQSGFRICPTDGSGWGVCTGEVVPTAEICDSEDNDCDGMVDEDTGGDPCNGSCGVGTTECVNGIIECGGNIMPTDEVCDTLDNDCDGAIDEEVPSPGSCNPGGMLCEDGTLECVNGNFECRGGVPPSADLCDCDDNDCDGTVDEEGDALCPQGSSCQSCQCAFPCGMGEFPCPFGQSCREGYCITDACFNVECPPLMNGDLTECVVVDDGMGNEVPECQRSCDLRQCGEGFVCVGSAGECFLDNCLTFPERCDESQICDGEGTNAACVSNPCAGVDCPGDQYCQAGQCYDSCAEMTCGPGESCSLGVCRDDPCQNRCNPNQFCDDGDCRTTLCTNPQCTPGEDCDPSTGSCRPDPCLGVVCPGEDQICREGSCYAAETPDDGTIYVAAVGGGGCGVSGPSAFGGGSALLLLLVFLGLSRRRREEQTPSVEGENA